MGVVLALLALATASRLPAVRERLHGSPVSGCPAAADVEELRQRSIKGYLRALLAEQRERRARGIGYELALVPRAFDAAAIERALREGTLADAVTVGRMPLASESAIEALDAAALAGSATIVSLSTQLREVTLTPLASVRAATAAEIEADSRRRHRSPFGLEAGERARGFGAGYFWIDEFPPLSLSCCDGRGDKQGLSPAWHVDNDLRTLRSIETRFMVVNQCGVILTREIDGYMFRRF